MDFRYVFLEPKGRLSPRLFAQGYILLTAALLVITVVATFFLPGLGILQYALVFPFLCVFGKRFHDAGMSAWFWVLAVFASLILQMMLTILLMPGLSPDAWRMYLEATEVAQVEGSDVGLDLLTSQAQDIMRAAGLSSVASLLIASAIIGLIVYRLRPDPKPNRHGPPPGNDGANSPTA